MTCSVWRDWSSFRHVFVTPSCPGTSCRPSQRRATPGKGHRVPCLPTQPWLGLLPLSQVVQPDHCHSDPSSPLLTQATSCSAPQEESHQPKQDRQRLPTAWLTPSSLSLYLPPRSPHVGVTSLPSFPLPPPMVSALPWLPVLCLLGSISGSLRSALPPHLTAQRAACRRSVQAQPRGVWFGAMAEQSEPAPDTA